MNKTSIIPRKKTEFDADIRFTPSDEALICLSCPLPECNKFVCKRFKEEKKKLKNPKI